MRVELKPCPLCGGAVMLDREDIFCDNCHLILRFDDYVYSGEAQDLKEATELGIEAWNSRVETEEVKELKDKIAYLYKEIERIAKNTVVKEHQEKES